MKIRKVALAYGLLVATVGSSATALAVVPDCRIKAVWVMKLVKNSVSKATLERWKLWGIKHPAYKPQTASHRPRYKSVWVREAVDQFNCFPEVTMDLWTDTTNADTEVAQLSLLPQLLTPVPFGGQPSTSGETSTSSTTTTGGQQDTAAGEYYLPVSGAGVGGGYYFYPPSPGSGAGGTTTPISTLPPTGVSGTTIGTPSSPALTPEPASLLLLATGLFGMALVLARFGGTSLKDSALEAPEWSAR